ncbi:hypothetical protein [uncultured Tenacibaculum sp.]|uniref:hypothetical protein n=1 Tax=uncultured Tenacibaculum sp. TaxID=174713 RepID=UPI002609BD75|nr:hypothetical protein [uncultured Tenacibaculum sp.]
MKKSILNLGKALNKAEQKDILGGRTDLTQADFDKCKLYMHYPDGSSGWSGYVSYEQASSQWNGTVFSDNSYASGYCCASCR